MLNKQCERNGSLNERVSERRIRFCAQVAFFGQRLLHLKASLVILIR